MLDDSFLYEDVELTLDDKELGELPEVYDDLLNSSLFHIFKLKTENLVCSNLTPFEAMTYFVYTLRKELMEINEKI